jgi:ABC-type transport auxiliary lipoprotein component
VRHGAAHAGSARGGAARCGRCGATLYRQRRDSIEHTLLLTLAALILFVIANTVPFLPPYLDRPQLVTRAGSNRMVLADFDSWAEPLQGLFARVLAKNLTLLLGRWAKEFGCGPGRSPSADSGGSSSKAAVPLDSVLRRH